MGEGVANALARTLTFQDFDDAPLDGCDRGKLANPELLSGEAPRLKVQDARSDKGYVNQRAVPEHRRDLVERLYAEPWAGDVIVVD